MFSLLSCNEGETIESSTNNVPILDTEKNSESLINKINSLPDSVLVNSSLKKNKFQYDFSNEKIDIANSSKISGEWISKVGGLSFFKVKHDISDKVVFSDKKEILMTGWGEFRFNRSSKWYNTASLNYLYEYYIDTEGYLNVLEFNYRNDDLSFKNQPEVKKERMKLEWINDTEIDLIFNGIKFRYSRL